MATAIEFDHVGKQYRLGVVSMGTLGNDLKRWWTTSVLGKEDPFLKVGEVNDRSVKGDSEYVWALKDIDFKVEQGDVVGIIGRNGAGKSTLLKLLSRVTGPTVGEIRARGRIGSLLEVGTGFHPEMTGRENIYMNGTILGMTKPEIDRKLDEIIDFSGCERYIDTPVKRYSSGMMVRLGFAVAAHLEPEILIVDEVLAVGDAEFQKKAIGKMQDVSKGEGRTVLFVSHNMASVRSLCKTGVVLENGTIGYMGTSNDCIDYYLSKAQNDFNKSFIFNEDFHIKGTTRELEFISASIDNRDIRQMASDEPILLSLRIKVNETKINIFTIGLHISNANEETVATYISPIQGVPEGKESFSIKMVIRGHNLSRGRYTIRYNIGVKDLSYGVRDYDVIKDSTTFEVVNVTKDKPIAMWHSNWGSILLQDVELTSM